MSELAVAMRTLGMKYPTCVQRINHPIHNGLPNPRHGKFFFVGSIPYECYDLEKKLSKAYDTEQLAIEAAVNAGAERIQRCDCSFVDIGEVRAEILNREQRERVAVALAKPALVHAVQVDGRDDAIRQIKSALKARGLRYSVTGGRGTSWGWICIDLLPAVYKALDHDHRKLAYRKLGDDFLEEQGYTSISVPASSDYYREYIERARGLQPTKRGQPYWD